MYRLVIMGPIISSLLLGLAFGQITAKSAMGKTVKDSKNLSATTARVTEISKCLSNKRDKKKRNESSDCLQYFSAELTDRDKQNSAFVLESNLPLREKKCRDSVRLKMQNIAIEGSDIVCLRSGHQRWDPEGLIIVFDRNLRINSVSEGFR
jgi:hypothetical protein